MCPSSAAAGNHPWMSYRRLLGRLRDWHLSPVIRSELQPSPCPPLPRAHLPSPPVLLPSRLLKQQCRLPQPLQGLPPAWASGPLSSMVHIHQAVSLVPRLITVTLAHPVPHIKPRLPAFPQLTPKSRVSVRHSPKHSLTSEPQVPEDLAPPGSSPHAHR